MPEPLQPYRFSLDRCLWPPDRDDVQCGKQVARAWGYFCAEHEIEGGGPHEFDLSATALSADATPTASADVGPDHASP